jgi:hypothetical protein
VPQSKLREETVAIQRVRLAIHHSYLRAKEQSAPSMEKFLLDVVIYAKMFAF